MTRTTALLLAILLATFAGANDSDPPEESPHASAIKLVIDARRDEIRALDKSDAWWFDTKERSWSARRPFEPGWIDSTHFFQVTYRIDGRVVGSWSVNTRSGKVVALGESIQVE